MQLLFLRMNMHIQLPDKVHKIIEILEAAGYEAYAVGGCVRDSVLGREPNDWDITTSAKPEETKRLFYRTIDTGIKHGTVTVMLDQEGFEVTTYRIDGVYEDSRHPKEVTFTASLEEDLKRRDFTVNAMAYNERAGLVDVFGGIRDIEQDNPMRRKCGGTFYGGCAAYAAGSPLLGPVGIRDRGGDKTRDSKTCAEPKGNQCGTDTGGTG